METFITVTINDEAWKFIVLTDDEIRNISDENGLYAAETSPDEHIVRVSENNIDFVTILHELFHVYSHYLYLDNCTKMTHDDKEEAYATMISYKGEYIISLAKKITRDLNDAYTENRL